MKQFVHHIADPLPSGLPEPQHVLGGKGASLHAMTAAGLPVPPAFVIGTECCASFFANGGKWPEGLEAQIRENLARLESDTGRQYGRGAQPLLVSVRSGAAVSMPGMMDTLLNCGMHQDLADEVHDASMFWSTYLQFVRMFASAAGGIESAELDAAIGPGSPDLPETAERAIACYEAKTGRAFPRTPWDTLAACIELVFQSWHSERAVAYRLHNDIRGLVGTAVTVQAMFPSEVSGILFTRNPVRPLDDHLVLEGSYGLGEAVVSGAVEPDRFIVSRETLEIFESHIGSKASWVSALGDTSAKPGDRACLTPAQVHEICEMGLRVEEHFGHPVDIEWAWANGRLGILQARPIRGLDITLDTEVARVEEIARLRALAGDGRRVWVEHNLGETLRAPTPLTWDIVRRFMTGAGGFGRMYRDFGYLPSEEVTRDGFLELICGRIYADPARMAGLFWDGVPMGYDLDAVRRDPALIEQAPDHFEADRVTERFLIRLPQVLWAMRKTARAMKDGLREAHRVFEETVAPRFVEKVATKRAEDLSRLGTAELIAELRDRCAWVLDDFGAESLKPGFWGGAALDRLSDLLAGGAGDAEGRTLAAALCTGLEGDITMEQDALIYRVSRGEAGMEAFLDRFGHRCLDEMELMTPRWREDPSYLERLIRQLAGGRSPEERHHANRAKREATEKELPGRLAEWGIASRREEIAEAITQARALLPYREAGKYYLMMGYELIRLAIVELARRWDLGNDVFFLRMDELGRYEENQEELAQSIASRKTRWKSAQQIHLPDVIDSAELDRLGLPDESHHTADAHSRQGVPIAPGVSEATARIVLDARDCEELGRDYALVCPSTDPGWTPLFINARALIVEKGGTLSHGAIVARDFGIPAVVCPGATQWLASGTRIRVDGNTGWVTIVEEK